jgi:hypothetical protein
MTLVNGQRVDLPIQSVLRIDARGDSIPEAPGGGARRQKARAGKSR